MARGNSRTLVAAATMAAVAVIPMPTAFASVPQVPQPHITATPASAMVNSTISLHGIGFPPRSNVRLTECSMKNWIVPQRVCSTGNSRQVRTDRRGTFTTGFTVNLCPRSRPGSGPVTARTCYIGEPHPSGVDTVHLLGAVKVTVTYP